MLPNHKFDMQIVLRQTLVVQYRDKMAQSAQDIVPHGNNNRYPKTNIRFGTIADHGQRNNKQRLLTKQSPALLAVLKGIGKIESKIYSLRQTNNSNNRIDPRLLNEKIEFLNYHWHLMTELQNDLYYIPSSPALTQVIKRYGRAVVNIVGINEPDQMDFDMFKAACQSLLNVFIESHQ